MIHYLLHPGTFPFISHKRDPSEQQTVVLNPQPSQTSSEGSEFIDDGLRMTEQPLTLTEVSVGVGSPDNLW